ncbi:plasmid partitioning/stability family protein, partial [Leclercia pneumoniae]
PETGVPAQAITPDADSRRRRYTLALQDDRSSERVEEILAGVSSRLRGELLRNLIISGLALHTTAPELPRLLTSMPVPPATAGELLNLVGQVAQLVPVGLNTAAASVQEKPVSPVRASPGAETSGIKKNMRRAFGD